MSWFRVLAFSVGLVSAVVSSAAAGPESRPNVVLIYADDLGWKDTGHTGSDFYLTPNLDRLAREGMVFSQAYAAAAMCAPSRAALLTGRHPARIGYYGPAGLALPTERLRVKQDAGRRPHPARELTIAQVLKSAGYQTGMVGKWQLGRRSGQGPRGRGFSFAHVIDPKASPAEGAGPKRVNEISRVARSFIERNRDKPFFLYVSQLAVHTPVEASKEKLEKYQARTPGKHHRNPAFAAMVEHLDDSVGAILSALEEQGVADRTLVMFTSDNGPRPDSPQTPLRGFKGSYYEGGIRVPLFVRWPGHVRAGATSAAVVNQLDLFPTILAVARVAPPKGRVLDGVSLIPILDGSGQIDRSRMFWHAPVYTGGGGRRSSLAGTPVSVVRKDDWKLLLFHDRWALDGGREALETNGAVELYDLSTHLDECCDASAAQTEKRDELLDELLAWIAERNAPLASEPNPEYQAP